MKNRNLPFFLLFTVFFTSSSLFALNPSRTYKQLPDKYNMKYEAFMVPTEDGAKLKAWYFPANVNTTRLVLISHNGEGNMADYLRRVDQFTSIGFNVVTYDYRGFGESSEFEVDNNMFIYPHFQDDMKAMIDFCRKQFVQTFHLYGWGIGAGLSLGIGWNRNEVKAIIADTPFLSMEDLETRLEDADEPFGGMEVPFAGYDKKYEPVYSVDNQAATLKNNFKNVLLIIGSNDALFKLADMEKIAAKQKKMFEKKIFVVENPDRKDNFRVDRAAYFTRMGEFLSGK
ncbi:MAG: alpha/beta hydrolase [Bacteroidota bacterium]